jgi:hypothetical protein
LGRGLRGANAFSYFNAYPNRNIYGDSCLADGYPDRHADPCYTEDQHPDRYFYGCEHGYAHAYRHCGAGDHAYLVGYAQSQLDWA